VPGRRGSSRLIDVGELTSFGKMTSAPKQAALDLLHRILM